MEKITCRYCKSENTVKRGLSQTQNRGKQQRHLCKDCKKTFILDNGFWKKKNSEAKITATIDLYFSNLSSRKVRNHFRRHWEHNASHVTVLNWCREYTLKVSKFIDTLKPQLSGQLYADETEIPRGCNTKRKGGDKFWCAVDWGTRYINATLYSPNPQNMEDAVSFMAKIKQSNDKPKYIQTDALTFYPRAFTKVFYNNIRKKDERVKHLVNNVSKTGKHNVRIETVFSKIKDRVDDFRGIKALWSAPILMQGIILQHNYIEAHTTTGKIPAELAGIKLDVEKNRWLGLILLSQSAQLP
ncbi:IS1/IS6 family transposase [Candidatus Woesearchaeota archaeon]|nr:IS1/IS6 family transposase [Candidatus Woesearchaeota archaeon]